MDKYQKFAERYESGEIPWDYELPPPELIAWANQHEPGRMLDVGCGYGRTALYLAQRGWQADGVDFVELAILEAQKRADQFKVSDQVRFFHQQVTHMPFLETPYDLVVDIGCMHSLGNDALRHYAAEISRLVVPGGVYLLFAHLREESSEEEEADPRGIPEATIRSLFEDDFIIEDVEHGMTQVEDKPAWESAWFWLRRKA